MVLELLIGALALLLILGMAGGSTLFVFVLYPMLRNNALEKKYPTKVPGWKLRLSSPPPFNATLDDVAKALDLFLEVAVSTKGYSKSKLKKKVNGLYIEWLRPQNEDGKRYIVDQYGRKIAGDHSGDMIRVVVLDDDTLGSTAFFHEIGHEAHELEGIVDYNHEDKKMWNELIPACKKAFK